MAPWQHVTWERTEAVSLRHGGWADSQGGAGKVDDGHSRLRGQPWPERVWACENWKARGETKSCVLWAEAREGPEWQKNRKSLKYWKQACEIIRLHFFFKKITIGCSREQNRKRWWRPIMISTWTRVRAIQMERREKVLEIFMKKCQQDLAVDLTWGWGKGRC